MIQVVFRVMAGHNRRPRILKRSAEENQSKPNYHGRDPDDSLLGVWAAGRCGRDVGRGWGWRRRESWGCEHARGGRAKTKEYWEEGRSNKHRNLFIGENDSFDKL